MDIKQRSIKTISKLLTVCKGQLISKANCQALNSFKKQMYEFVFTTMQRVFVCFLLVFEDTQKKPTEINWLLANSVLEAPLWWKELNFSFWNMISYLYRQEVCSYLFHLSFLINNGFIQCHQLVCIFLNSIVQRQADILKGKQNRINFRFVNEKRWEKL